VPSRRALLPDLTLPLPAEDREVPETDAVTAAAAASVTAAEEAAVDAVTPPDPTAAAAGNDARDDGATSPSFAGTDGFDSDRLLFLLFFAGCFRELDSFGAALKTLDFREDEALAFSPIDSFTSGESGEEVEEGEEEPAEPV